MGRRIRQGHVVSVALLVLVVAAAGATWAVLRGPDGVMSASSARSGHPAELAAPGTRGAWRSDEGSGAWLQRSWDHPVEVTSAVLQTAAGSRGEGVTGFLRFSDGSQAWVQLTEGRTVVPLTPRRVSWVRFTFIDVPEDAGSVGLGEFDAGNGPAGSEVSLDTGADGDVAALAAVSGTERALVDASKDAPVVVDEAVELRWERPHELARIEIAGAGVGPRVRSGRVEFSDGSSVPVGGVTSDASRPTTVAFMPRSTTSLRLVVDSLTGPGSLRLSRLAAYQRGAEPATPAGSTAAERVLPDQDADCPDPAPRPSAAFSLLVQCPLNGSPVGEMVKLQVSAGSAYRSITAVPWGDGAGAPTTTEATPDAEGRALLEVDVSGLGAGPFVLAVSASGARVPPRTVHLQLMRAGEPAAGPDAASAGRTKVYDDDFSAPLSASRTGEGSDYVTGKPEHWGVTDFGEAIFADPAEGLDNVAQREGLLELSVRPRPSTFEDPQGWGRDHIGGMLASARPGGSGFSAQYGYFEARMLAPAEPGTWPAFWLLTNPDLVDEEPVVAEIDAVELYGHDPDSACHTSHRYPDPDQVGTALCGQRWDSSREAMAWHTYAVDVRPDGLRYFIDGELVGEAPPIDAAEQPMFFMLDLALGGGWPIDLSGVRDRATLYVDWVRVYV